VFECIKCSENFLKDLTPCPLSLKKERGVAP